MTSHRVTRAVRTGALCLVVAGAFAASTAIFNATYQARALVDTGLSNGADVTVTGGAAADLTGRLSGSPPCPG